MTDQAFAGVPEKREYPLKRPADILCGLFLACFTLLLLPGIALAIRVETPGPIFFVEQRLGRGGRPFRMWKFRTMRADAHRVPAPAKKGPFDPRVTRVGRWLRRTSLDELPQAWNILRGEMSVVGPRPLNAKEIAAMGPRGPQRLAVRPGLTGLWQVSGRSNLPLNRMLELDLQYVSRLSLREDLRILLRTVPAVLTARGAY
ncbi:MAG: sugar transferase [Armatimonadota bacterium]|nr:sugar transferase [Armatimonadota bacterium]